MIYEPKTKEELNINTRELYNRIIKNNLIKGSIKLENDKIDYISWNIDKEYIIEISLDYHGGCIDIYKKESDHVISLVHWHPEFDEIYADFLELNNNDNIIIITIKRRTGKYNIIKKIDYKKEKYKNSFFIKYYIIGEK